jgi:hypothetical protein
MPTAIWVRTWPPPLISIIIPIQFGPILQKIVRQRLRRTAPESKAKGNDLFADFGVNSTLIPGKPEFREAPLMEKGRGTGGWPGEY